MLSGWVKFYCIEFFELNGGGEWFRLMMVCSEG